MAELDADGAGSEFLVTGDHHAVVKVGGIDTDGVIERFADMAEGAVPAELGVGEEVEHGEAAGLESGSDEGWEQGPGCLGLFDLAYDPGGEVVENDIEAAPGAAQPLDGVGLGPAERLFPGGARVRGEEVETLWVEIDTVDGGGETESAESGESTAAAEAQDREMARGGMKRADGGEQVEDAVGGAGLGEDFAEHGAVLGQAPAACGTLDASWRDAGKGGGSEARGGWIHAAHRIRGWRWEGAGGGRACLRRCRDVRGRGWRGRTRAVR